METFTLHAEPSRTEPDRACSQTDVWFYSPADERFCCAVGLTSSGWIACLFTMSANTLARMKTQEMIFQEIQKQKGTQNSTISSQMQLFHYEDGRSNQRERGQHLTAQSFFLTFSEWQLCYIRSYLFFHYPISHTLFWVPHHYLI